MFTLMNRQNFTFTDRIVQGLANIADGLVLLCTLGFVCSDFSITHLEYTMEKAFDRKANE